MRSGQRHSTISDQDRDTDARPPRIGSIEVLTGELPDEQRLTLESARLLREGFLQQSALDQVDTFSSMQKQIGMLGLILHFHQRARRIVERGALIVAIQSLPVVNHLIRMKTLVANDHLEKFEDIRKEIDEQIGQLEIQYR